jgi:hypothetical protein
MSIDTQTIAFVAIVASLVGMAWAIFWPGNRRSGGDLASTHWDLIYVDDNGVLIFTLVRVLSVNHDTRRLTAWCSRTGSERVFKFSKIVKATDVNTGVRIHLRRLSGEPEQRPSHHAHGPADAQDSGGQAHGIWRRVHLYMH